MHFLILHHRSGDPVTSKSSPHVRESKIVLDSGFYNVDSGFQVLNSEFFVS